jgi:hypothetical protein
MKSQKPTWAIIVAIFMMLIGGCGIKNDVQYINIRSLIGMKDKIFDKIEKAAENKKSDIEHETRQKDTSESDALKVAKSDPQIVDTTNIASEEIETDDQYKEVKEAKELFGDFLDVPEETIVLMIRLGYIGLFFSFLYLLGGLFLLIKKPFSINLAYAVLGANIAFSLIKWIVLSGKGGSLLSISNSVGAAFSVFSCIIFIIIIVSCDKSHYEDIYTD